MPDSSLPTLIQAELVQWPDGVGRVLRLAEGNQFLALDGICFQASLFADLQVLVRRIHSAELVFVHGSRLKPYPSEPIPQPGE